MVKYFVVRRDFLMDFTGGILTLSLVMFFSLYSKRGEGFKEPLLNNKLANESNTRSNTVSLSIEEVSKHKNPNDCWVIVNSFVYNLTYFLNNHPGGSGLLIASCGTDITTLFATKGGDGKHSSDAEKMLEKTRIGELNEKKNADNLKTVLESTRSTFERETENEDYYDE